MENDDLDWLIYTLMLIAFIIGFCLGGIFFGSPICNL